MRTTVVIVNYNVKYFLELCLLSVSHAAQYADVEIIVVDNQSTDGSLEYLKPKFPKVHFLDAGANLGFGKACNLGCAHATGEYILFLNPDTVIPPDTFTKATDFFSKNKDAGAIGVRMVDGCGKFLKESKRAFPTPLASLFKLFGFSTLFPSSAFFSKYHLGHLSQYETHEVDVLCGAFMMLSKSILDSISGFDEQFFMYGEDIDLSYRIQKTGYKNYYFADINIIHFKGESTKKGSLNYVKIFYQAMSVFVQKHYKGSQKFGFSLFLQLAIWIRAGFTVLGNIFRSLNKGYKNNTRMSDGAIGILGTAEQINTISSFINSRQSLINLGEELKSQAVSKTSIQSIYQAHPFKEIIFCVERDNWQQIFNFIMWLPTSVSYSFMLSDADIIIRSNNKNLSGVIFKI